MKFTIKLFLVIVIAASTIIVDDGNMGNGGYTDDGNMGNGGRTCTVTCPEPTPEAQTNGESSSQTSSAEDDDDSILTVIEDYLESMFG
jgi:hypothetical protein